MMEPDPRTHSIIGAAMEVHRQLGPGFLEAVYVEALAVELELRQIPFVREAVLPVRYKDRSLGCTYRVDFVCHGAVLVEVKALAALSNTEIAQLLNYLKAGGQELGLLINFGSASLTWKRLIRTRPWANSGAAQTPAANGADSVDRRRK